MLNIFKNSICDCPLCLMSGVTFAGSSIVIKGSTTVFAYCSGSTLEAL